MRDSRHPIYREGRKYCAVGIQTWSVPDFMKGKEQNSLQQNALMTPRLRGEMYLEA